jgi:hypothetical protein
MYAGRLYDALSSRYGPKQVFLDLATIEPGMDFQENIQKAIAACDVVLVVIGRSWTDGLENPSDFIRLEVSTALRLRKHVVPILVNDAAFPMNLPVEVMPLTERQGFRIRDTDFHSDVERLCDVLNRMVGSEVRKPTLARESRPNRAGAVPVNPAPRAASPSGGGAHSIKPGKDTDRVFVSSAEADRDYVDELVETLERVGHNCWASHRELLGGEPSWAGAVAGAIATSKTVVVVVSRNSIASKQVLREITLADSENIPFVPFCIDDSPLSQDLKYFFATAQRLTVNRLPRATALDRLAAAVTACLERART